MDLREALVMAGIQPEQVDHVIKDMETTAQDWLLLSIIDLLPSQQAATFDHMVATQASSTEISAFLRHYIPNLDSLLQQRFSMFKDEIIATIQDISRSEQPITVSTPQSPSTPTSTPIVAVASLPPSVPSLDKKSLQKQADEVGKQFKGAVQKGDWGKAVELMQKRKEIIAQQ